MSRHGFGSLAASGAVLIAATGFALLALRGGGSGWGATYTLTATISSSFGVGLGSEVQIAGVRVGRIVSINLDEKTYLSKIRFTVDQRLRLPDDSRLVVQTGEASEAGALVIKPGASARPLVAGGHITTTSPAESLEAAIGSYVFGGDLSE